MVPLDAAIKNLGIASLSRTIRHPLRAVNQRQNNSMKLSTDDGITSGKPIK